MPVLRMKKGRDGGPWIPRRNLVQRLRSPNIPSMLMNSVRLSEKSFSAPGAIAAASFSVAATQHLLHAAAQQHQARAVAVEVERVQRLRGVAQHGGRHVVDAVLAVLHQRTLQQGKRGQARMVADLAAQHRAQVGAHFGDLAGRHRRQLVAALAAPLRIRRRADAGLALRRSEHEMPVVAAALEPDRLGEKAAQAHEHATGGRRR